MFELTNRKRKFLGLSAVGPSWDLLELMSGRYDTHASFAYCSGNVICKRIAVGGDFYEEYDLNEETSDNRTMLLPKTKRGKVVKLTAATLGIRTPKGMHLAFNDGSIYLGCSEKNRAYYTSVYEEINVKNLEEFSSWTDRWVSDTTESDLEDIAAFALSPKRRCEYHEGDFFRLKLNRRLYGYGRILLDYGKMRKDKLKFWDILMGKPLVIKIYHIVTTDRNISVEDLSQLAALPSQFIMDNAFFYGEYEIVGNLPLADGDMDFPIMYGGSIAVGDDRLLLQVGRHYHELDGRRHVLYTGFRNSAIGWCADIKLPVLRRCIGCHSNEPYWNQDNYSTNEDLRNPRFSTELDAVCCQFGLTKSDILLRTRV